MMAKPDERGRLRIGSMFWPRNTINCDSTHQAFAAIGSKP